MADSLEAIHADFLKGIEQMVNAFNRLLVYQTPHAWHPPLVVRAEIVPDTRH